MKNSSSKYVTQPNSLWEGSLIFAICKHVNVIQTGSKSDPNVMVAEIPDTDEWIEISKIDGGIQSLSTDWIGTFYDLQDRLYPCLTWIGNRTASLVESDLHQNNHSIPTPEEFKELLDETRSRIEQESNFYKKLGIDPEIMYHLPIWVDENGRFNYVYRSLIGIPICRYSWYPDPAMCPLDRPRIQLTGVPRLQIGNHKEVYFVEDPLQAEIKRMETQVPVYVLPTTSMYYCNFYDDIIEGRDVTIFVSEDHTSPYKSEVKQMQLSRSQTEEDLFNRNGEFGCWERDDEPIDGRIYDYQKRVKDQIKKTGGVAR